MFARPLIALGSVPSAAAAAAWRQPYWRSTFSPTPNSWRSTFSTTPNSWRSTFSTTPNSWRSTFSPTPNFSSIRTSFFPWTNLLSTDPPRYLHMSAGLMKPPDPNPPVKRRKSWESEEGEGVQPSAKRSRESQESGPVFLQNVPAVPLSSEERSPSLVKTELKRQWEDLTESRESQNVSTFDFSVMSYNILAQELLLSNPYLYKHCHPGVLEWCHRFPNLLQELEEHAADIMCLQEVQEDHYQKQIKPSLEHLGYHCEYKRRTGHKQDGCMVAFKTSRFTLLSSHPVEFFRQGISILDRDNVGLIVVLKPAGAPGSERSFCVVTTHLLFNPRRGDIKLAQLALLLAETGHVARQDDGTTAPILLCGDFNSVPSSPLYSFITDRKLKYAGMPVGKVSGQEDSSRGQRILTSPLWPSSLGISQRCQYEAKDNAGPKANKSKKTSCIEHTLSLSSVYSHYLKESRRREITTWHSRTAITVDYIFYSPAQTDQRDRTDCSGALRRGLQLLSRLALVSTAELKEVNGLPNQHHSSDHLPLLARFRLHS